MRLVAVPKDDAMQDSTTKTGGGEGLAVFGPDTIETITRVRVRATVKAIMEEVEAALGAEKSARIGEPKNYPAAVST